MKSIDIKAEGKTITIINYLKGYSIITIVLMHILFYYGKTPDFIMKPALLGGSGVHVFFFCSGCGLYYSYLNHNTGFVEFLKKRFLKIYLPYIFIVFMVFLLPWSYHESDSFIALLSHIFLFKMFVPAYDETFGNHFWFISTIIQFYMIFIPMCYVRKKVQDKYIFIFLFGILSIIWWIICYVMGVGHIRVYNSFFLQYIWEFALGVILAEELFEGKTITVSKMLLLLTTFIGLGMQAIMTLYSDSIKMFNDIPAFLGYTSLALLLSDFKIIKKVANSVSFFSYELYLVHVVAFSIVFHLGYWIGIKTDEILAVVAFFFAFILGYLYKILCEKIRKIRGNRN